jgi:hypothetical protein
MWENYWRLWHMCIACWIHKATNTHTDVILIAFPLRQWLHKRASILRYTYIACLALRICMKKKVQNKRSCACVHMLHHAGMWQECTYEWMYSRPQHRYNWGVNFMPQSVYFGRLDGLQEFVWIPGRRESSLFCARNWPQFLRCPYHCPVFVGNCPLSHYRELVLKLRVYCRTLVLYVAFVVQ